MMMKKKIISDVFMEGLFQSFLSFFLCGFYMVIIAAQYRGAHDLVEHEIAEVGELSELFMWKGEVPKGLPGWEEAEKDHLGEELSDVLLYLIRLSDMCGVDLGDAATKKIVKNAVKYPAPSKSS
ncbi:hypothetical protein GUJ93_ZPchr0004g40444 [Zizania palustris]|uniref:dCTP pyrophosphatase 1 n=1 Tax=Zizania palustris TaxID=103762 RepID=A0A8J5SCE1_ZIZPA|nr:hypothetical protein GUJ93_ZPchr0004g40444 [Zizania palustris]